MTRNGSWSSPSIPATTRRPRTSNSDMSSDRPLVATAPVSRRVMNLAHFLTAAARRFPDRPGCIWGGRHWRWAEIDARVSAIAAGLAANGIGKGSRILVHSKNGNEMFESMFAAFRLGAVWVPTNFRLLPDEVAYLAEASGASAFLCHGDFPAHVTAVRAVAPNILVARISADSGAAAAFSGVTVEQLISNHVGTAVPNTAVEYDDPCWFFFTSR